MKILCYATKSYDRDYLTQANTHGIDIDYVDCLLDSQTAVLATGYDLVCIFVNDQCDSETLKQLHAQGVQGVLLRCAGYNNVDLATAHNLGIIVARVPEYSPYAVAEHTVGLLLCLNRKIHKAYNRIKESNFSLTGLIGHDLCGKTVGVVGYGSIGRVFANIMSGFSCRVLVHDPYVDQVADGHTKADLNTLFEQSDIISLHCPLSEATKHLIDANALAQMKSNIMILNTSRGGLVDTKAVIEALKHQQIAGLAIDVYEEESALFFDDHSEDMIQDDIFQRLTTFPNVLITGHQGFLTHEALSNIAKTTLDNALRIAAHEVCENVVVGE